MAFFSPTLQLALGFVLGALVGFLANKAGALNRSGSWAAGLVGAIIFGLGGLSWAALLLTFFISSSVLSRAFPHRKSALSDKFAKGARRDYAQVLANGGLGALLAVIHVLFPGQPWPFIAFAGAMATVNADTWATELGVLSPLPPRLISTGKAVEPGTSGGVTLVGYLASLAGAGLIGLEAGLQAEGRIFLLAGIVVLGGLSGATFDSLLGATLQAIYFCPACRKETERHPLHGCGNKTSHLCGWSWLNNDWVNFLSSAVGALVTVLIGEVLS